MTNTPASEHLAAASRLAHTTGSITALLAEKLAGRGGAELIGRADLPITHIDSLERAGAGAITFVRSRDFLRQWETSVASAALAPRELLPENIDETRAIILVRDADQALSHVLELMAPPSFPAPIGVHPTALVDPTAVLGAGVSVGPQCIIGPGVRVGDETVLVARVFLGRDVRIGRGCKLHVNVSVLDRCVIGDGCNLHGGAVIGTEGFGYRPNLDGKGVTLVPHIGNVDIGNGVDLGANTCVDRAKWGSTTIGDGCKIDNLVQIGHGAKIGRVVLMAGQVGVSGSATIGDGVMLGGQAGVVDNVEVGKGAMIAGQSGVTKKVPAGEAWFGMPAMPSKEFFRDRATLRRLALVVREQRRRGEGPLAIGGAAGEDGDAE